MTTLIKDQHALYNWPEAWSDDIKLRDLVFLDVETTGGKPQRDGITEIGLLHVCQGELVQTWHTFVKPLQSIPPWITRLTGISNAMVDQAPSFAQIAQELAGLLAGKVLVAHNARFDYSFLKAEFKRLGIDWNAQTLCTVKLSRALFADEKRHGLDALIARYGLVCQQRHRALDDAQVLWAFFQLLPRYHAPESIWSAVKTQLKQPSFPPNLSPNALDQCEDVPGVYRFYDSAGQVLYVGKSIHLRSRILSHFNSDHRHVKELQMSAEIHDLDWTMCSGDLGAQLLEAQEIKRLSPKFNVKLRKLTTLWSLVKQTDNLGFEGLTIVRLDGVFADQLAGLYGLFRSKKQAESALETLVNAHNLCHRLTGLEKKKTGACFAHQLNKCKGACVGKEPATLYNLRQSLGLLPLQQKVWPWPGAVLVKERTLQQDGRGYEEVEEDEALETLPQQVIYQWCWLGTVHNATELADLLSARPLRYGIDLDQYRILCKFLLTPPKGVSVMALT